MQAFKEQVQNSSSPSQGIDPSNGRQNDFQGFELNGGGDAHGEEQPLFLDQEGPGGTREF